MAREKIDNKLNVVIGTKAQVEADSTIPENSIIVVTDEELTPSDIPQLAPSKITQDANNRFVTDTEKATWNGKQNALTAGDGISISGNVISATGGGLTVEEWNTDTKILELSDSNKLFKCSYSNVQDIIIPTNEAVAFPIGTMITFLLTGTNTVTFGVTSGVILTSMDSLVELATQFAMASLIKIATDTWQLVGALE